MGEKASLTGESITTLSFAANWTQVFLTFDHTRQISGIVVERNASGSNTIILDDFLITPTGWDQRAFWGSDSIKWGTDGTSSRHYMGPMPAARDSWTELIVKTDDVGTSGLTIDGLSYTLYNGGAYWDYSALGGPSTGTMTLNNLVAGQKVELYNATSALVVSGTVPSGSSSLTLDMYSHGINVFPFKGYLKVYSTTGSVQYSSPLMSDVWGGDVYSYNQPFFSDTFNSGSIGSTIHSSIIGQARFQTQSSVPEETYNNFDLTGNVKQVTQIHNGSPLTTNYTYDQYGNVKSSVSPTNQIVNYTYSATYGQAYLTNVTRLLQPNNNIVTSYFYNATSGNRVAVIDPMGNRTDYSYDAIGRNTAVKYPAVNGVRSEVDTYYDDRDNMIDVKNEKGNYTRAIYDGLGRQINVLRYTGSPSSPLLSNETYTYNWQSHVSSHTGPDNNVTTYSYDFLGRQIKVTNPDLTFRTISYNDLLLTQSSINENQNRTDYAYDALGRLVSVVEYYSQTSGYATSYSYDGVGNLVKVIDGDGQSTVYSYDDLNRLFLTKFPDGFNETRAYDSVDNLSTKKDPNGNTMTYSYDNLARLTSVTYPDGTKATFAYDGDSRRVFMSNPNGTATFTYDARNRETSETWTIGGSTSSLSYAYDTVGNLVSIGYPDKTKVTYSMDSLSRVSNVGCGTGCSASLTYAKNGRINTITYGNNVQTTYTYDSRGRPTRINIVRGSTTLLSLSYGYDSTSNVVSINSTSNELYRFDALNRLVYSSGPWQTLQYGYDAAGNRLWMKQGAANTTYTYGSFNRLLSAGPVNYAYDNYDYGTAWSRLFPDPARF